MVNTSLGKKKKQKYLEENNPLRCCPSHEEPHYKILSKTEKEKDEKKVKTNILIPIPFFLICIAFQIIVEIFFNIYIYILNNQRTFHAKFWRTLFRDPNLRVLIVLQQLTLCKFGVSIVIGFKPRTMCYLLRSHFSVFALINWVTLMGFFLIIFMDLLLRLINKIIEFIL